MRALIVLCAAAVGIACSSPSFVTCAQDSECPSTAACTQGVCRARTQADGGSGSGGPTLHALNVVVSGQGTVRSSPAGIDCGSTCAASFSAGTQVTLTASLAAAWGLAGWGGACSGIAGNCGVTLNGNASVAAKFTTLFSAEAAPSAIN